MTNFFCKNKAEAKLIINKKKREFFYHFIESTNSHKNLSYFWKKVKTIHKSFKTIEWNKWQLKDRNLIIIFKIDEINSLWIQT